MWESWFASWKDRNHECRQGASKRRKKRKERRDSANVDDSCTTDDQRKKPTYQLFQLLHTKTCATYNLYGLRQQCPGTRRPSGLVDLLHNDNVVLTPVCYCRCNATTAAPATTSKFMKTWTACATKQGDVRGPPAKSRARLYHYVWRQQRDDTTAARDQRRTAKRTAQRGRQ